MIQRCQDLIPAGRILFCLDRNREIGIKLQDVGTQFWRGRSELPIGQFKQQVRIGLVGEGVFSKPYKAFGLDYEKTPIEYSVESLARLNDSTAIAEDRVKTLVMLNNWRRKFDKPPKLVFLCVSGGGKRAALWALNSLQTADSLTNGQLINKSVLITGASGGLIGASYFRELKLREMQGENVRPYSSVHRDRKSVV